MAAATSCMVKETMGEILVLYLAYFHRNKIYHHVNHSVSGKSVCFNHCSLQYYKFIAFCQMVFFIVSHFESFINSGRNISISFILISENNASSMTTMFSYKELYFFGKLYSIYVQLKFSSN